MAISGRARTLKVFGPRSNIIQCGLTGRSTGHFAAGRVWASFHSRPNPARRKMPVSFNVSHQRWRAVVCKVRRSKVRPSGTNVRFPVQIIEVQARLELEQRGKPMQGQSASVGDTLKCKDAFRTNRDIKFLSTNKRRSIVFCKSLIPATACKTLLEAIARQIQRLGRFASSVMFKAANVVLVPVHALLANLSLNRTLHSVPAFGPPFHSGPNTVPLFRAG